MTAPFPLSLVFEDELSELLAFKIFDTIPNKFVPHIVYNRGGNGYISRAINGFNVAARGIPFYVGTDLDAYPCPSSLIDDWLDNPKHDNLLLRVAVREAEAWVLADRDNFAHFVGINSADIPANVEALPNPKATLIQLAKRSRNKQLREDICPSPKTTSKVGPNYNARLGVFVNTRWNPNAARTNSRSLDRTIERLIAFQPLWVP